MSTITAPVEAGSPITPSAPERDDEKKAGSPVKRMLKIVGVVWLLGLIFFIVVYGLEAHKAREVLDSTYSPVNEFKLDTWFSLGPVDFNKGVLYVILAGLLTVGVLTYVARHIRQRPGRLQVLVEWFYSMTNGMARDNLDESLTRKYFPLIATLFVFIYVTNMLGYIPLPVNSTEKFNLFGAHIPSFQIYAADTNVAFPLVLALMVFCIFTYEGVKAHGPITFLKNLVPDGVPSWMRVPLFGLELLSYFLRLISLTVRLWANLLAGHLLIGFMSGVLGSLMGYAWLQWALLPFGVVIFLFEATLIAFLQAFIFAILTAIYIGSSVSKH